MSARKIMLLGEIGVGKSSIVRRLVFDRFDGTYSPTIGVEVYRYEVPAAGDLSAQTLIVWDTDGNFGDAIFQHVYMRQASAALIIADLSRPQTLENMRLLADSFAERLPGRYCGLVLNKVDLIKPEPGPDAAAALLPEPLRRHQLPLTLTSASTGHNVRQAFHDAAAAIARRDH